jgi:hypothetical protein
MPASGVSERLSRISQLVTSYDSMSPPDRKRIQSLLAQSRTAKSNGDRPSYAITPYSMSMSNRNFVDPSCIYRIRMHDLLPYTLVPIDRLSYRVIPSEE